MTLAEIMAGLGASQAVGGARTGALLTQTVEGERRDLRDARKRLEEQQKERDRKAKRRDKRRGFGRLVGGGIGFLLGGAPGAALGSAIGQGGAAATQRGGYKLDDVSAGLGQGMFFKGGREDISTAERDINRYLDDANTGFITNIATSAVSDYLTAGQLGKAFPGIRGGGFKAIGEKGLGFDSLMEMLRFDPETTGLKEITSDKLKLKRAPNLSKIYGSDSDPFTKSGGFMNLLDARTMDSNKKFDSFIRSRDIFDNYVSSIGGGQ